jgi:iron(III) transport system permease protein
MATRILPRGLAGTLPVHGVSGKRFMRLMPSGSGQFLMAVVILVLGSYLIAPLVMLVIMSFNVAPDMLVSPYEFGVANWSDAWGEPKLLEALWNSILIWLLGIATSLPTAILIAWVLARTNIRGAMGLEYMFWVAFMFPGLSSTLGWIMILDPDVGYANRALQSLSIVDEGPFNIFSIPGIVWARLMSDGIAYKVMLLTPAFRNMDSALEEAARVSGASTTRTMLRITLPMMAAPIALVFALQLLRIFEGFETEQLLGAPWGFYVYSTYIYRLVNVASGPMYGQAVVLAMLTIGVIALIIPFQRRMVSRRTYVTLAGNFQPGVVDLGRWRPVAFYLIAGLLLLLTILPMVTLLVGSFMLRAGFFETAPLWTLAHWNFVFGDPPFLRALLTTITLAVVAGIGSPLLFSLVAYLIVRTRYRGRGILDSIIWLSAGLPGVLSGLGLLLVFLVVPGLSSLYGSIWALILVVVIAGNAVGTNIFKGVLVQLGNEMEEAARVSGAGWLRTWFTIVLPMLMPTLILIGVLNFTLAAGATSSIVLLASQDTMTLSLLTLEYASPEIGEREAAGILSLIIMSMTLGVAIVARSLAAKWGIQHPLSGLEPENQEDRREP